MPEIKGLTGLRGYAALWVCLLHYTWGTPATGFAADVARHGSGGLVLFFVLSGFILSYVYAHKLSDGFDRTTYGRFLWARFARVYPLHLLTLFAWLGFVVVLWGGGGKSDTLYTFVLNLLLLHAWGFTDLVSWNQPSWSISAEAFAYLLFPFMIAPLYRAGTLVLTATAVAVAYCVWAPPYPVLVGYLIGQGILHPGAQFSNGVTLIQFFTLFAAGVVLFCVTDRIRRIVSAVWAYDALFLLGIGIFAYACTVPLSDALMALASALTVAGLYRDAGLGHALMGNRVSFFLGEVSYSLYLAHIMVGIGSDVWLGPQPLGVKLSIALAVSAALHYGFERPARSWLRTIRVPAPAIRTA